MEQQLIVIYILKFFFVNKSYLSSGITFHPTRQMQYFLALATFWTLGNFSKPLQFFFTNYSAQTKFTRNNITFTIFSQQLQHFPIKFSHLHIQFSTTELFQYRIRQEIHNNFRYFKTGTVLHSPSKHTITHPFAGQTGIKVKLKLNQKQFYTNQSQSVPKICLFHISSVKILNQLFSPEFPYRMNSSNFILSTSMEIDTNTSSKRSREEDDISNAESNKFLTVDDSIIQIGDGSPITDPSLTNNIQITQVSPTITIHKNNSDLANIIAETEQIADIPLPMTTIATGADEVMDTGEPDTSPPSTQGVSIDLALQVIGHFRLRQAQLPAIEDFEGLILQYDIPTDAAVATIKARPRLLPVESLARANFDKWTDKLDRTLTVSPSQSSVVIHFLQILYAESRRDIINTAKMDEDTLILLLPDRSKVSGVRDFYQSWEDKILADFDDTFKDCLRDLPSEWHQYFFTNTPLNAYTADTILLDLIQADSDEPTAMNTHSTIPLWKDTPVKQRNSPTIFPPRQTRFRSLPVFLKSPSLPLSTPEQVRNANLANPPPKPSQLLQAEQTVQTLRVDGTEHDHPYSLDPIEAEIAERLSYIDNKTILALYVVILNYSPEPTLTLTIASLQSALNQIGPGLQLDEDYVTQMYTANHWAITRYADHLPDIKHPGYIIKLREIATFGTFQISGRGSMAHLHIYPTVSTVNVDNPRAGSHKCFIYPLPCGIDIARLQDPKKYPPLAAFRRFCLYRDRDAILSAQFLSIQNRLDSNLTRRGSYVQLLVPYFTEAIHVTAGTGRRAETKYEHPSYDPTSKTMNVLQLVSELVFLETEDDIADGLLSPSFQMIRSKLQEQIQQQTPVGQATHPVLDLVHEAGFCFETAPSYDLITQYRRQHPATAAREVCMVYHIPPPCTGTGSASHTVQIAHQQTVS